jgi:pantetheine-phosphate adenylyltransferase
MVTAAYCGSFDPVTNGHLDIIGRAAKLFDSVIVGVYATPSKRLLFTTEERVALVQQSVSSVKNVQIRTYTGLTVDFAKEVDASTLVRGLRTGSDFENEFEMALMNNRLRPDLESVFFITDHAYQFLSSSLMKEVASLGGDVSDFCPPHILSALNDKYHQ